MSEGKTRVNAQRLTEFSALALERLGVPKSDALITGKMLVQSDLRGVESHGVAHLRMFYARRIRLGIINLKPKPHIYSTAPATALMDGDHGLGFVIGHQAMNEAIRRAKETGAGFVAVNNSTHIGAGAYYAMMALEHDMVGLAMANTVPGVVAPGSSKPAIGTNPLAVAVPSGKKPPFVLDMATSAVAGGKIEIALRTAAKIPEGWMIDGKGNPVTDPTRKLPGEGGLLPLGGSPVTGGYKGFGLGVFVEIMTAILSGTGADLLKMKDRKPQTYGNDSCHFFGALRIDSFIPVNTFKMLMDGMITAFENLPKLPGVDRITIPGGYEDDIIRDRELNGIPLDPAVVNDLKALANKLNISYDL